MIGGAVVVDTKVVLTEEELTTVLRVVGVLVEAVVGDTLEVVLLLLSCFTQASGISSSRETSSPVPAG